MSELEQIHSAVKRAAQRRRWQRGWRGLWQGFLMGSCLWLTSLVVFKVFPIPFQIVIASAVGAGAFVVLGFIYGWLRPMSLAETARWLDEKQNLKERLSTALEISGKPIDEDWKHLLVSDAAGHARTLNAATLLPLQLPRASHWALLVLALGAGLGFVPEYRTKEYVQKQKDAVVIKDVGAKLVELTKRNLENRKPTLEPVRESLQAAEQLGDSLAKNPVTRAEALKDLASVTDKLKSDLKELGKNPALKSLDRAARQNGQASTATPAELQKQIDNLQKSLGDKSPTPDALDKLKNDLASAQKAAAGMPSKDSANGQAARQQLAQSLSNAAREAREMGLSLPDLDEAIAALQAEQTDLFLKDLNAALTDLEKLQEMAKAMQRLQQQASKLGKDLSEQLKNGQAELAQQTLNKMIEQLKASNLSKEQLEKIMQEVQKAVDPASKYGKVGECLSKACQQMKSGQKPGAAQSLADAADELKKLMDQMGDAQQLASALEALKKAQMCVGNCQGWGQCQGMGAGGKSGNKPGRGVGTWAEETGWIYYPEQNTGRWDNSGINRPDIDERGLTDRGEGELSDSLTPTKVRGQFSPGGPMPSITLKGVSIKGQSTVEYQEAVSAAQSEAQSAINHDQVPKAYRGAVKDYFDDLKP